MRNLAWSIVGLKGTWALGAARRSSPEVPPRVPGGGIEPGDWGEAMGCLTLVSCVRAQSGPLPPPAPASEGEGAVWTTPRVSVWAVGQGMEGQLN